ncbi:MAG: hypothetical protein AB2L11_01365 [Syntrophobacteraceae bacterium]
MSSVPGAVPDAARHSEGDLWAEADSLEAGSASYSAPYFKEVLTIPIVGIPFADLVPAFGCNRVVGSDGC